MQAETFLLRTIRSVSGLDLRQVRFKANRVRLLSVSRDGETLYLHTAFRNAPGDVVDAIATFLRADRGSAEAARAVARLRSWATAQITRRAEIRTTEIGPGGTAGNGAAAAPGAIEGTAALRSPPRPGRCCGTPAQRQFLTALYRDFNRSHCGGRLPTDLFLRFSDRMRRRLGHIRYHKMAAGERVVIELALNIDLMGEGSESQLRDTLLHEMAHVEAWLQHGDRGHGAQWRRIARRLGCVPRACTDAAVRIRPRGSSPTRRVPPRHLVG